MVSERSTHCFEWFQETRLVHRIPFIPRLNEDLHSKNSPHWAGGGTEGGPFAYGWVPGESNGVTISVSDLRPPSTSAVQGWIPWEHHSSGRHELESAVAGVDWQVRYIAQFLPWHIILLCVTCTHSSFCCCTPCGVGIVTEQHYSYLLTWSWLHCLLCAVNVSVHICMYRYFSKYFRPDKVIQQKLNSLDFQVSVHRTWNNSCWHKHVTR